MVVADRRAAAYVTARLNVAADVTASDGRTFSGVRVTVTNYGAAAIRDSSGVALVEATAVSVVATGRGVYRVTLADGSTWTVELIDVGCGCSGRRGPRSTSGPQVVPGR